MKRTTIFIIILMGCSSSLTQAQIPEIDTLQYFDYDSLGGYCYMTLGDVEGWYMRFDPPEEWDRYNVIQADIVISDKVSFPILDWLFFGSDSGILSDTGYYHASQISISDSTDVYPNWKSYDLSQSDLKNLQGSLWLTTKYDVVDCDTTKIKGHTFFEVVWPPNTLHLTYEGAIRLVVQKSGTVGIESDMGYQERATAGHTVLSMFPNPTNSHTWIHVNLSGEQIGHSKSLTIYNLLGQALFKQILNTGESRHYLLRWPNDHHMVNHLPSGIYLVVLGEGENAVIKKLAVIK
ncbi:MAG: T9SS type A sorting domain-containing protein [Candidatus Neomarinimicrobiota bacterium]